MSGDPSNLTAEQMDAVLSVLGRKCADAPPLIVGCVVALVARDVHGWGLGGLFGGGPDPYFKHEITFRAAEVLSDWLDASLGVKRSGVKRSADGAQAETG